MLCTQKNGAVNSKANRTLGAEAIKRSDRHSTEDGVADHLLLLLAFRLDHLTRLPVRPEVALAEVGRVGRGNCPARQAEARKSVLRLSEAADGKWMLRRHKVLAP